MLPTGSLEELGNGAYAWLQVPAGHGAANAGVVVDNDGITVIDTLMVPSQVQPFIAALEPFGLPIKRVVYSSSHIEFVGGSAAFWMAARYGRSQTSALLDQPSNPAAFKRLHPRWAAELGELDERGTRPVSHTVDTAAWLSPRACALPQTGQQLENLVVLVPEADVLFAGALCCFGVTPNAFDGDPQAWADTLGELSDLATTIVPGIGPIGGADELLCLQAYLYACVDADGDSTNIPPGPWDTWTDRHFDEVNVERAARIRAGDYGVPTSMLRLLGMA
jgi:cyclase